MPPGYILIKWVNQGDPTKRMLWKMIHSFYVHTQYMIWYGSVIDDTQEFATASILEKNHILLKCLQHSQSSLSSCFKKYINRLKIPIGWRVCCEKCRDMKNPNFRLLQQKIFNNSLGPGCQSYSNFFSQKNLKINCK